MPIHFLSTALSRVLALETYPIVLSAVFAIVFLKQWSSGLDLLGRLDRKASAPESEVSNDGEDDTLIKKRISQTRDLHGTVVLMIGGFSSQGLLVCAQLSSLGAQLILLTPKIRSSRIIQMVHLLRDGTSNPLIYAEECDITNLASVEAFADKWNQGQGNSGEMGGLGAGPAGDLSASTGFGAVTNNRKDDKTSSSPRRIDSIIFMPLDSAHHSIGQVIRETSEGLEYTHAEILGRVHLINKLLPTLLLLPPYRDIRIISLVSPWYASGLASFNERDPNYRERISKSRSPWTIDGACALLWLSLSREIQRRIQLMTDADIRPRSKLPGIHEEGKKGTNKMTNVNIINVCAGFERGRNIIDYLLPNTTNSEHQKEWIGEKDSMEGEPEEIQKTISAPPSKNLRAFVNPESQRKVVKTEKTQTMEKQMQHELSSSSWSVLPIHLARYAAVVLFWPFAWLLCKSPKRAAETVTWATVVPIFDGSQSSHLDDVGLFVVPGELHREGRLLRPILPQALIPGDAAIELYRVEEQRIKTVLKQK